MLSSENNQTLPGANVLIEGTSPGTTADLDGSFLLSGLGAGFYSLVFSYSGFQNVEIELRFLQGRHQFDG